ncbi:non-canonical purine NTP pyrophosphatase [Corallococcus sp. AB030]|uniref:non-canonical purine NTP pyrophosphatase n=1 Tax=unclassified Corallococcus TaxID=2685029 RepID=UPI000ED16BDE|nr:MULTISPECIES: non-canonical purine NTP pyrophosphatase [unclassified Corallococcus]RKI20099.1 non-canonical purine NTP pyrophosphatase [Corallococcus sp. AB030]RUO92560.1 non-canonical purine NTP pyrophosphatase [Corallococcus sp. AB018]
MPPVYFSTSNAEKFEAVKRFFHRSRTPPRLLKQEVPEVLSHDLDFVVREKAFEAYRRTPVHLFVEHGGLYIDHFKQLPGPLVKPFWNALQGDLCTLIPPGASRAAHVIQRVCYCDGQKLQVFEGRIEGSIAPMQKGTGLHWEPVFIPAGQTRTMGEMPLDEKLACSGSAQAYGKLRKALGRLLG